MELLRRLFGRRMTEDRFAKLLRQRLAAAGDERPCVYDSANFLLRFFEDDQEIGVANLRNVYEEHVRVPASQRAAHMSQLVRSFLSYLKELPEYFADARADLLPIVRSRSFFEFVRLQSLIEHEERPQFPSQELGDHLLASVVYDLPESVQSLSQQQLDEWGVSYYEAMEIAIENLAHRECAVGKMGDGLYALVNGDSFDPARLLLEVIRQLEVQGDPVAMVPNRNTVLLCGGDDLENLAAMLEIAEQSFDQEPRPMAATALRLNDEQWQSWLPEPDHPLFAKFKLLYLKTMAGEYREQKEILDELHAKRQEEVAVANFCVVENRTNQLLSYCLWAEGAESLLPRTDQVYFVRSGAESPIAFAPWQQVERICGYLLDPVDSYPPRYRVNSFPSREEFQAMGAQTVEDA